MRARPWDDTAEYHGTTQNFVEPRALQLVWPDAGGHLPGEPGWDTALDALVWDLAAPAEPEFHPFN